MYDLFTIDYVIRWGKPVLYLFVRDKFGRRKVLKDDNFRPRFYVEASERPDLPIHPVPSIDGNKVTRIETKIPKQLPSESRNYVKTYENNILFPLVYLIDKEIYCGVDKYLNPTPEQGVKPKVVYIDSEIDVDDGSILVITVHDNYTDKETILSRRELSEEQLLKTFVKYIQQTDPDIITAWNVHFDIEKVIQRCRENNVNYKLMSPLGHVELREKYGKWGSTIEGKILGRTVFDLWEAYAKFFQGKKFESERLEDRAEEDLGIKKTNFDYKNHCNVRHIEKVIKLNRHHVDIERKLDEHWGLIRTFDATRRTVGCNLNQTLVTMQYGDILLLRECKDKFILPGKKEATKSPYEGAYVKQPPKGVFENVAVLDIAAQYPNIIRAFNLSPETYLGRTDELEETNVDYYTVWKHKFRKKPIGVYPRIIEKLQTVRTEVKEQMKKVNSKGEYNVLWCRQYAYKQCIAACYGLLALPAFRLFKQEVAEAITGAGRDLVKGLIEKAKELGFETYCSDTDSIQVQVNKYEDGQWLEEQLNKYMYDKYVGELGCHVTPVLEFEKMYKRVLYVGVKKRYVGLGLNDEMEYKGFEIKKSNSAPITRDLQKSVFNRLLREQDIESVRKLIKSMKDDLPNYPLDYLGVPQPLNKPPEEYERPAMRKAVFATQDKMNVKFNVGDKPRKIPVKWVGESPGIVEINGKNYEIIEMVVYEGKLPQGAIPDYDTIYEKCIWAPLDRILTAIGLDRKMIDTGEKQVNLFEF